MPPSVSRSVPKVLTQARRSGTHLLLAAFLFSIFVNLLMLTGPLFMLQVYDRVLSSRSEETLTALFMLVGFLYAMMACLDYARGRLVARYGAAFQAQLNGPVFDACFDRRTLQAKQPMSISAQVQNLESIQSLLSSPVFLALFDLPWSPMFLAAIFIFHPTLGWVALAGAVVLFLVALLNRFLTAAKSENAQHLGQSAQSFAASAHAAQEVVETQAMRTALRERWLARQTEALSHRVSSADWIGSFTSFSKAARLFLQSAMLGVGAFLVLAGELTAGAMIAGSILLGRALAPIEQTVSQWASFQRARKGWKDIADLLANFSTAEPRTGLPVPKAQLDLKQVVVMPPNSTRASLRGIDLSVLPGQALGVIGKSGSGKSTLAKAILGYWPTVNGSIRLGGAKLDQYNPDDLGRYIGYLPQNVTLIDGTIAENIARMGTGYDDLEVVEAATRANAHEMILSLPDGYNTQIRASDTRLSGGQKQRIGLARALFGDPVLLILDEPNSALDADGSEALNQAIRDFKATGKSVLVMTHRPTAIAECEHLAILRDGKLVALGPRDEILRSHIKNADSLAPKLATVKNQ